MIIYNNNVVGQYIYMYIIIWWNVYDNAAQSILYTGTYVYSINTILLYIIELGYQKYVYADR